VSSYYFGSVQSRARAGITVHVATTACRIPPAVTPSSTALMAKTSKTVVSNTSLNCYQYSFNNRMHSDKQTDYRSAYECSSMCTEYCSVESGILLYCALDKKCIAYRSTWCDGIVDCPLGQDDELHCSTW
jgi:hypothetical protein